MVWKQDLAKLKQQLREEPELPPKPLPKPKPKPSEIKSLDEEDAVFLAAMGRRPPPSERLPQPGLAPSTPPRTDPPVAPESFQAALEELKGLKPLPQNPVVFAEVPAATPPPSLETPLPEPAPPTSLEAAAPPEPTPAEPVPAPPDMPSRLDNSPLEHILPVRFQLAAGMAIDVDGVLDLRGHSRPDAMERLKDRLEDGILLGWRTMQVILGNAPDLHEALLAGLSSGEIPRVSRYAQAPVPMGGTQAWLLYLVSSAP